MTIDIWAETPKHGVPLTSEALDGANPTNLQFLLCHSLLADREITHPYTDSFECDQPTEIAASESIDADHQPNVEVMQRRRMRKEEEPLAHGHIDISRTIHHQCVNISHSLRHYHELYLWYLPTKSECADRNQHNSSTFVSYSPSIE